MFWNTKEKSLAYQITYWALRKIQQKIKKKKSTIFLYIKQYVE